MLLGLELEDNRAEEGWVCNSPETHETGVREGKGEGGLEGDDLTHIQTFRHCGRTHDSGYINEAGWFPAPEARASKVYQWCLLVSAEAFMLCCDVALGTT